jgi:hypothetical protein
VSSHLSGLVGHDDSQQRVSATAAGHRRRRSHIEQGTHNICTHTYIDTEVHTHTHTDRQANTRTHAQGQRRALGDRPRISECVWFCSAHSLTLFSFRLAFSLSLCLLL